MKKEQIWGWARKESKEVGAVCSAQCSQCSQSAVEYLRLLPLPGNRTALHSIPHVVLPLSFLHKTIAHSPRVQQVHAFPLDVSVSPIRTDSFNSGSPDAEANVRSRRVYIFIHIWGLMSTNLCISTWPWDIPDLCRAVVQVYYRLRSRAEK